MGCEIEDEGDPRRTITVSIPERLSGHGISEGKIIKKNRTFIQYNKLTDIMFVDLLPMEEGSRVEVVDIGHRIGILWSKSRCGWI